MALRFDAPSGDAPGPACESKARGSSGSNCVLRFRLAMTIAFRRVLCTCRRRTDTAESGKAASDSLEQRRKETFSSTQPRFLGLFAHTATEAADHGDDARRKQHQARWLWYRAVPDDKTRLRAEINVARPCRLFRERGLHGDTYIYASWINDNALWVIDNVSAFVSEQGWRAFDACVKITGACYHAARVIVENCQGAGTIQHPVTGMPLEAARAVPPVVMSAPAMATTRSAFADPEASRKLATVAEKTHCERFIGTPFQGRAVGTVRAVPSVSLPLKSPRDREANAAITVF